jgi:hypothetical protein
MINYGNTASEVHQAAFDLAVAGFGTRFKTYRKTPVLQVAPQDLPVLGVYRLRRRSVAWGQSNQAEPKFQRELTIGFSAGIHAPTASQDDVLALHATMEELEDMLLSDPAFVTMSNGFESMDELAQFAKVGETTLYEIRNEMVVTLGQTIFPPNIPDWFNTLHVESRYPKADTDPAEIQQIIAEYDVDETTRKKPN